MLRGTVKLTLNSYFMKNSEKKFCACFLYFFLKTGSNCDKKNRLILYINI